jgi:predicted aspartyl protease
MPSLPVPQTISFDYVVDYAEVPLIPVVFSHQNRPGVPVLCLVDSGASGILLPSELADQLGVSLDVPSRPVIGVTGVGQGWVQMLRATLPDVEDLAFTVEVVFLPQLPIALTGREPFFQHVDIAFRHPQDSMYFRATRR